MNDECLICGAELTYSENDTEMECALCHRHENSKTACENGHYVCNECHTQGMDAIIGVCLSESSKNPIEILRNLMALPFCHMHGPEHHIMVGAALLTAYKNAGGEIDLHKALIEIPSPDIAISMGCDVGCPFIGRGFDDNWGLPDPTGQSDEVFTEVIKQIEENIRNL